MSLEIKRLHECLQKQTSTHFHSNIDHSLLEEENEKLKSELVSQGNELEYWKEKYRNFDQSMPTRLEQTLKKLFETENALNEMTTNY